MTELFIYKAHGPAKPGPGEPQSPRGPVKSLGFLLFKREGSRGMKLAMYWDADGVFWAEEVK